MRGWTDQRVETSAVDSVGALLFPVAGLSVLVVSAWIPWTVSRIGDSNAAPRLLDLNLARWAFLGCAICIVAGLWAERRGRDTVVSRALALVSAVVLTAVPILGMAVIELVTVWLSPERLPATFRRLTLGVKPMPGIWLTALGGALCLVGATGEGAAAVRGLRALGRGLRGRSPIAWTTVTLVAAVALLTAARYLPWVRIDSSLDAWAIPGWAMPWIGFMSLTAAITALGIGFVAVTRPSVGAGVALSSAGWAISFLGGMTILAAVSIPTIAAPVWVVDRLGTLSEEATTYAGSSPIDVTVPEIPTELQIGFSVGPGAVLAFASGLVVMACAGVVCRHATAEASR